MQGKCRYGAVSAGCAKLSHRRALGNSPGPPLPRISQQPPSSGSPAPKQRANESHRPLKAQVAIRDHWTKADSPVQTSLRELQELLGRTIVVEPEWRILVAELDTFYDDKTNLVTSVAGCVRAWARSMTELLDDEAHADWTEEVLVKASGKMWVYVEVATSAKAATTWSEQRGGFVVSLPKKQVYQPAELFPTFRQDLLACFAKKEKPQPSEIKEAGGADDWEGVEVNTSTGTPEVVEARTNTVTLRPQAEFMPDVASLPRPDQLFLQPPYHLTLFQSSLLIELHGSHSPSLKFLAEYLKRWCRVNHADTRNPPGVQIDLHQSAFGLGEVFDRLTLSTEETKYTNQFTVTAPMVVSLIEGVLGYKLISTDGRWNFRRDTAFKTL
ncbi:hypothetical protein F5144DRAFT_588902 [Chaetomium tenue]|uniref:Uncharacterized protein n=1 Tax=Chaetomium tenue TaxID=1854479 RepID=A0ACB7PSR0_9PEZI|nr:hypothetical protein F5144DRAFT_588902 [Chaetomium globosum]